ncbi:cytochrome P450 20A1 [Mixophyes fleayi]|uniref:cytochrome P450 20A1 n=1 Tax=Mixophyes fleayi TaxID=3061075 RepID=UPI003F4D9205
MLDFAIFAITFLLILVGAVLYLYPSSRQACGIPGLAPTEEKDGNLQDIVNRGSLHEFLVNLHEKFGPVASFWFGRRLVVSLGSLDLLRQHINPNKTSDPFQMMLKSLLGYQSGVIGEAAESHLQKKLYENGINKSLQSNFSIIIKLSEELLAKWSSYPQSQHVPLCQHMLGFAMKSITQTAMGSSFEDDQEVIRFRKNHEAIWSEIGKGFLDGSIERSPSRKKQYENALMEMETVLKKAIKERRGKNPGRHVFMDSLLQGNLSDKQVLEDSMIFSLAGCVITANLCTWAIYFLTTAEGVQDKFYKEVIQVLGKGPITMEKLEQLSYGRQILCETVRTASLTPIAARLQELEGRIDQHIIPKETLVLYALGVVLQDSTAWPSAYRFNPDRFEEEMAKQNLTLLGFSGSQECPELRFAYMVAMVLLCVLVRKLHLLPVKGQVMESKYELVTSPKEEAWITVSKRS